MPAISFIPFTEADFKEPSKLNAKFQELVDNINVLLGVHGPIPLLNDLDMGGRRITNLGKATAATDGLSQEAADLVYGAAVQQKAMEAVGTNMLQSVRRLNDGSQQHRISSDLNAQGTIAPTLMGQTTYVATAAQITVSWPTSIQFGDQTSIGILDPPLVVTGLSPGTYKIYPYFDTNLGLAQLVADSVNAVGSPPVVFAAADINAAQVMNADGHIPLSSGAVTVTVAGGGSGGGGGSNCVRFGMLVESQSLGPVRIESVEVGDIIRARHGWTKVTHKQVGTECHFIRIGLANGECPQFTASHSLMLFEGDKIPVSEITLRHLLVGIIAGGEVPLEITSLVRIDRTDSVVLLSCAPDHEYLVGSLNPSLVAHNVIPK